MIQQDSADRRTRVDLNTALRAAKNADDMPDDAEAAAEARAAAQGLYFELSSNRQALAAALRRFSNLTQRGEAGMLAAVLGRIRDPEVESLAIEAARSGSSILREAALDILDGLNIPEARAVALSVLSTESETSIRRAAVRAIPEPEGSSLDDAEQTVKQLIGVLENDRDEETRRLAALALGSWHRSVSDLSRLLDHLLRDPSPNVRAGCAFACEISGRRDEAVINALAQSMSNTREAPLVRDNCYRALRILGPLPATVSQAYKKYEQEIEDRGEGEASGE